MKPRGSIAELTSSIEREGWRRYCGCRERARARARIRVRVRVRQEMPWDMGRKMQSEGRKKQNHRFDYGRKAKG